jgi:hypothetical protein
LLRIAIRTRQSWPYLFFTDLRLVRAGLLWLVTRPIFLPANAGCGSAFGLGIMTTEILVAMTGPRRAIDVIGMRIASRNAMIVATFFALGAQPMIQRAPFGTTFAFP